MSNFTDNELPRTAFEHLITKDASVLQKMAARGVGELMKLKFMLGNRMKKKNGKTKVKEPVEKHIDMKKLILPSA